LADKENYKKIIDEGFREDLKHIRDNNLVAPSDWGLFQEQLRKEWELLDKNWSEVSRETIYPPLSTHGYRKRYMHSIPERMKIKRGWPSKKSDFRIIFKVREETNEIYYLGIGKRIKILPKDIHDIWSQLKGRKLPEE
jgi:mRNA-degrading endonuclease RelE of RelBE toxin-antitoxin system